MSKSAIFVLVVTFFLADVSAYGVNVTCNFGTIGGVNTCSIQRALVLFDDEPVNILGTQGTNPVNQVRITDSRTVFIIREIFDKFPALTSLEVVESGLKQITPNVFRNASKLINLNIFGNEVETLRAGAFNGLEALKTLVLMNSQVVHIEVGALAGLPNLNSLDFDGNQIENLHEDIFVGLNNLYILDFRRNRISFLPTKLFHPLRSANWIYFQSNQITRLDNDMFLQNGANVQSLSFHSNKIDSVGPRFFDNLVNLSSVNFQFNNCTNSVLERSSSTQSVFLTQIRAAFSICFNNFVDEPNTSTMTVQTTTRSPTTEIQPEHPETEVERTYILKVRGRITLLDENGNELFVSEKK